MALPITDFIVERLLEYDSTFDTGGGIATTQLMINPLAIIFQPVRDELDAIQVSQTILSILESDDPDAFDEDIVDALASNVFVERHTGGKASGTVRVRYFSPQSTDIGTGLASFLDTSNRRYVNVNPVSITMSEMGLNVDGSLYYVDIPVESEEEGSGGNVDIGSVQVFENEPPNIANVTNLAKFSDGSDRETNTELIDRIRVAVTVRALVTGRGIVTTLTDNYSSIEEINVRGFGDPEMQRDIVYNVHIGGNIDVWTKVPSFENKDYDVISLVPDTTRRYPEFSSIVAIDPAVAYPLRHSGIDRTDHVPVVSSADNYVTYIESVDYTLNDAAGTIERIGAGNIFHISGTTATITGANTIYQLAAFTNVRVGMQLKVSSPSSISGVYSVKSVTANEVTIYGTFPVTGIGSVYWAIDDILTVSYDYNPLSIDVIKSVRDASRENYTITDVPLMRLNSIEILDPTTLEPTGIYLDSVGGYGQGAYGAGPFGVGTVEDYVLKISIPNLRFSVDEDNFIDISYTYFGYCLRVNFDYASEITTYQDFMDDPQNNVETAMLKAKHFIPTYVSTVSPIVYYVQASNTSALTESEVQEAVEGLINDTRIRTNVEISDIVDILYNSGADRVNLDFQLKGEIHNTNGDVQFILSDSDGILEIPDNVSALTYLPDTDKPLSKEIAHFIPDAIVLTRVTT